MAGAFPLAVGRQQAFDPKDRDESWSSATFKITVPGFGTASFSELGGISSEIEQAEYIEANSEGMPTFGRFLGKAKPPTISLKRAMSEGASSATAWKWHAAARQLQPAAYANTELEVKAAGAGTALRTYQLTNAIPTKLELAGIKAGGTEIVMMTLTIMCDEIVEM